MHSFGKRMFVAAIPCLYQPGFSSAMASHLAQYLQHVLLSMTGSAARILSPPYPSAYTPDVRLDVLILNRPSGRCLDCMNGDLYKAAGMWDCGDWWNNQR
jgi:hypothetical protein